MDLSPARYSRVIGVPSSTCYMLTYDHLLNVTLPPLLPPAIVPLCAGMLARTSISSIMSPLELIRTNLQSTPLSPDNPHTLRSVLTSVRGFTRAHGPSYLWRGLAPTLWRDVPFSGLYWAGYEMWKEAFARQGLSGPQVAFVSGAISGTTAALLTSPFDVMKTRRQAVAMHGHSTKSATFPLMLHIIRTEGVSALYAGIMPRIAKIAPACGIMIGCFEVCFHLSIVLSAILTCVTGDWQVSREGRVIVLVYYCYVIIYPRLLSHPLSCCIYRKTLVSIEYMNF